MNNLDWVHDKWIADIERKIASKLIDGLDPAAIRQLSKCYAWRAFWMDAECRSSFVMPLAAPDLCPTVYWPEPPFSVAHRN